ncbi:2-phosphosulfolactate phosphatase [Actinacidiphila sp. bgisy160]|uniref:2-phosphosulfolactate phosphatase n=1 Tax=Actinacidiphila sp. bgisy160 TaxID=3413796 RepID=UPI003D71DD7A
MSEEWFLQTGHGVRFEWGPEGARLIGAHVACLVVVDVLSFTTAVTVAVEAGIAVHPYAWRDATAAAYARRVGARLAVGRREVSERSPWSLSPAALRRAPYTPRLVLPSPNGSTIAAAAGQAATVVAACLRNATAVGAWLARHGYGVRERPVAVIAAGERRPDGALRPSLEDLLGAGAVVAALQGHAPAVTPSPEARAAAAAFAGTPDPAAAVAACASGLELDGGGFPEDVVIATELDAASVVPVLSEGAFSSPLIADRN